MLTARLNDLKPRYTPDIKIPVPAMGTAADVERPSARRREETGPVGDDLV